MVMKSGLAEKYIIQYLFLYPEWFQITKEIFKVDMFKIFRYKIIFSTMIEINSADLTKVAYKLQETSFLKSFGGLIGLVEEISEIKTISRFDSYVNYLIKSVD